MVLDALLAGKAVAITAIYYLMLNRLARYERTTPKAQRMTVSRMKKSKSYAGQSPTEEDLVAAHVDPGRAPVQRVRCLLLTHKSEGPTRKEDQRVPLG